MQNPRTSDCECNNVSITDEHLDIKNFSCKKKLFGTLVMACGDQILSTTEISLNDKKVTIKKLFYSHYFIISYMLIIISCHFYQLLLLLYETLSKKGILIIAFNIK